MGKTKKQKHDYCSYRTSKGSPLKKNEWEMGGEQECKFLRQAGKFGGKSNLLQEEFAGGDEKSFYSCHFYCLTTKLFKKIHANYCNYYFIALIYT